MVPEALAQSWSVDAYAGQADYKTAPSSVSSRTAVVGIRFNDDLRAFQASVGLPLASEDVTWGVVGLGDRLALRRGGFAAGADVSVFAHAQRDSLADVTGRGLSTDFLPVIALSRGAADLELRSGVRWYGSELAGENWTRRLWTTDVRGGIQVGERVYFATDVRHERAGQGETYTRAGLSAAAMMGPVSFQGGVGHWVDGISGTRPEWDASIAIPIRPSVSIFASGQYESFNPQFLGPSRVSWSAGITFQIGRSQSQPAIARIPEEQRITIRVTAQEPSTQLFIAGDFTNWTPVAMERQDGEWRYPATLGAGVYHYAFRTADGKWFVPDSIVNRTDDGMGGWIAVLVVE
jgi:hypothetical protein